MKGSITALVAAALLFVSFDAYAQMYGDPSRYNSRAGTAPQGATVSCQGVSGNVLQPAYNGFYAGSDGTQFALIIQGQSLAVFVMRNNTFWLEGAANTGPSATSLNVPLHAPNGDSGILTLCATHLTTSGFCSRLSSGLVVNGALQSGLQPYIRTQTPNVSYCVKALSDKPNPKMLAEFERIKAKMAQ
jgi:hypothetical protein